MRSIQPGAVIMALKRLENKLSQQVISSGPNNYLGLGDLTLRSNLAEFTYKNSPTLLDKIRKILLKVDREKSSFLTFTHGLFETTLIVSKNIEVDIKQVFTKEELRSKFSDLSAITLLLPKEIVGIPGAYYQILKTLAWENINIIEVVSNYTELTIVLEDREVDKAFSALKNLS
ncbi:hypothetical protein HYS97_02455 [Candidatus Daviesbacteria bacterium]|nr:hypothetical protein [Candidatus Daviesbacteria bacterium]